MFVHHEYTTNILRNQQNNSEIAIDFWRKLWYTINKPKMVCVDVHDIAVVDPDMTATMPKGLTAAMGVKGTNDMSVEEIKALYQSLL